MILMSVRSYILKILKSGKMYMRFQ